MYPERVNKVRGKFCRGLWKIFDLKTDFFQAQNEVRIWGFSFLGRGFGPVFAIWSISSHTCVQIDWEMVRLIALIGWKLFVTHNIFKDLLKKISHTRFWQSVLRNWSFFSVFKAFVSNFLYYKIYLVKLTSNLLQCFVVGNSV